MTVRPDKVQALRERMAALYIAKRDLQEQFVLSGGRGGQKLQKTRNCVVLKHSRSGFIIRFEKERSREPNRYLARRMLFERLEGGQHRGLHRPSMPNLESSEAANPSE